MDENLEELLQLQEECEHPNPERKRVSGDWDDNGYDMYCRYWWDYTCLDCGERWMED